MHLGGKEHLLDSMSTSIAHMWLSQSLEKQQWPDELRPASLVHCLGMTALLALEGAGEAQKVVEAWISLVQNLSKDCISEPHGPIFSR